MSKKGKKSPPKDITSLINNYTDSENSEKTENKDIEDNSVANGNIELNQDKEESSEYFTPETNVNRSIRTSVDKGKTNRQVKGANKEVLFYANLEDWEPLAQELKKDYINRVIKNMGTEFKQKPTEEAARNSTYSYLIRNARNFETLTVPEEVLFLRLYHEKDDIEAYDILVNSNVLIAISVIRDRKFYSDVLAPEDMVQEGMLGVQKAIERFDLSRGFRLSTFMVTQIHQTVSSSIKAIGDTIRIPVSVHSQKARLKKAESYLNSRLGFGEWDDDDLLRVVNEGKEAKPGQIIKPHHLQIVRELTNPALSLDLEYEERSKDPSAFSLQDVLFDEDAPLPSEEVQSHELATGVQHMINKALDSEEAIVIKLIYGIDEPEALKQISKVAIKTGFSAQKVKSLRDSAMKKMRDYAHKEEMRALIID